MRIIRRHYKAKTKHYGIITWGTRTYRAIDFYWGKHLFVLGFDRDK